MSQENEHDVEYEEDEAADDEPEGEPEGNGGGPEVIGRVHIHFVEDIGSELRQVED